MRPDIFIRQSSFPYSLHIHIIHPRSETQQTENSISFNGCGHHLLPTLPPLQHARSKPQGRDKDQSTAMRLWMSRYLGCHSSVCWGQQRRGRNASVWGLLRSLPRLAFEGLCLLYGSPAHRPHLRGASSPRSGLTSHRPSAWGRDWLRHTLENTSVQVAVDPRGHHQL